MERIRRGRKRSFTDEQAAELEHSYAGFLPNGKRMTAAHLARVHGVSEPTVLSTLRRRGVEVRPQETIEPTSPAPLCKCGCDIATIWNRRKQRWNAYVAGHYRKEAAYKDPEWLRQRYVEERMTVAEIAALCDVAGQSITRYLNRAGIKRRNPSESHRGRQTGHKNPAWKGGVTPERQRLYKSQQWKETLSACFARDNYLCVRCGTPKKRRRDLHAHHLRPWADAPDLRMDIENLVSLCRACHLWVHSGANVEGQFLLA